MPAPLEAPPRRPPRGLRQRLLLAIMAPLTLVFAISVFLDYRLARETADAAFDQSLADAVFDIASHIQSGGPDLGVRLSEEAEAMLRNNSDTVYFAVRDGAGKLLSGDAEIPFLRIPPSAQPQFNDSRIDSHWTRVALYRVTSPHGDLTIAVAETLAKRNRASRRIMTAMILPNLAVIVAAFLAVYLGVRRGLAPLEQVEEEIATRSPRDLREIDVAAAPREIHPMLSRLNQLFGLLREASAAQQRFLADAAHQLRTPLAGLQTQIELLASEGKLASDSERLNRLDEATSRIGHLVDQLLIFARTEPATAASQVMEPVALPQLLERAASIFLDRALAKAIDLGFEVEPATVTGVPWMLREALANLIDNALRYTPGEGVITVRCGRRSGGAFLEIEDSGPGIPAAERERVFQRFYRSPGSPGEGCGMGLAIVREIAEFHGGAVRIDDAPGSGLRIAVIFPPSGDERGVSPAPV